MFKFVLMVFLLSSCGGDSREVYQNEPTPKNGGGSSGGSGDSIEAKYEVISPLVKNSCLVAGCHINGAIVDLTTAAKFAASNSRNRIADGSMPPPQSGPGKSFTADKKAAILNFFN